MTTTSTAGPIRFLVTAGNTRERIDAVRDWGNIFTGNTGLAVAKALASIGQVDLLTSNRAHLNELAGMSDSTAPFTLHSSPFTLHGNELAGTLGSIVPPFPIRASGFVSHEELKGALAALMARGPYAGVFMTAAVADYRPAGVFEVIERHPAEASCENWLVRDVRAGKVKSSYGQIAVLGKPTEKLVDLFRAEWGHKGLLVKFKLEVGVSREDLLGIGEASRRASGADYLVANTLDMVTGEGAGAYLLSDAGQEWVARAQLPERLARIARGG